MAENKQIDELVPGDLVCLHIDRLRDFFDDPKAIYYWKKVDRENSKYALRDIQYVVNFLDREDDVLIHIASTYNVGGTYCAREKGGEQYFLLSENIIANCCSYEYFDEEENNKPEHRKIG